MTGMDAPYPCEDDCGCVWAGDENIVGPCGCPPNGHCRTAQWLERPTRPRSRTQVGHMIVHRGIDGTMQIIEPFHDGQTEIMFGVEDIPGLIEALTAART